AGTSAMIADDDTALIGTPVFQILRSGLLWSCPLTQSSGDCKPLRSVVPGYENPPRYDEKRDGQWLGVAVNSQGPGKKVIVCAHRYERRGVDFSWGKGLCYTLTQSLGYEETWEPCAGRDTTRAHEQWGYCQDSPVDKYSYLGMAVAAGNFLPPSRSCGEYLSYAAGAPRANSTGQVVIFVKCHSELLNVQLVLAGDAFASQFGYALAAVDVNNDGFTDLFVSAPFYHSREFGGAVYYFKNSAVGLNPKEPPIILRGGGPESRFGFAISSAGDVNADGFVDVVIGAPYEDRGAVYLYHGGPDGLNTIPAQIVRSEDLPGLPIRTFGYSLSGGLDLDMNNHTDILVGAYASDAAVIIRSRPVIDILTWFGNKTMKVNPTNPGCDMDPTSPEVCFQLESCFQIRNFPPNIETTLLKYKITAEVFKGGRKFSRVRFDTNTKELTHTMEKRVQVRKYMLDGCFQELVYLKEGTVDIRSPIRFLVEYSLGTDEPTIQGDIIPNINQFPILNMKEASKELEIPFHLDCGDDDFCQSNLVAGIKLIGEDGLEINGEGLELGEGRELVVNLTISNTGDPAYTASAMLNFSEIFTYVGRSDETKDVLCELVSAVSISCNLGNPFHRRTETLQFKFVPVYSATLSPDVMFTVNLTTSSANPLSELTRSRQFNVIRRSEVSIRGSIRPEYTLYGGQVVGESSVRTIQEVGTRVVHTFHVVNDGPWPAHSTIVNIDWPFQVENDLPLGKWLLYLTDPVEISPPGVGRCYLNPKHVNSLGLRRKTDINPRDIYPGNTEPKNPGINNFSKMDEVVKFPSWVDSGSSETKYSSFYNSISSSQSKYSRKTVESEKRTESYVEKIRVKRDLKDSVEPRVRRDTEHRIDPDRIFDADGRLSRVVVFDCGRGTAKCLSISCDIPRLGRGDHAIIRLSSRVWNSTLVEDYPHVDSVLINAVGRLQLPTDLARQQMRHDDEVTIGVIAYPDGLGETGIQGVPIWIMITAIMAGLLLVVIITLILWKFGFFERKRVSDVTQTVKIGKTAPLLRGDEYIS
ncbi:integrin alpha-PS1, partial [Eurytemora carolleeae]|uniref:integrin alpha-PS1 n=1 Tax=Eurytemora carolleeae TaxID=1294199 RepID=UPI000C7672DC